MNKLIFMDSVEILLCLILLENNYAQNLHTIQSCSDSVRTAWIRHYFGPDSMGTAVDLAVDRFGNVYVTGSNVGMWAYWGFVTVKYNSDGEEQWVACYKGPGNLEDEPVAIAVDDSGCVYIVGYTFSSSTDYDYAIVKYDSNGTELWSAIYNGPNNTTDMAIGFAVDDSGNVYITGVSWDWNISGSHNYLTIKYNKDGVEQWVACYNGPADYEDHATDIVIDDSGDIYVTGYSTGEGTGWDFATIKYNSNGVEQWIVRDIRGGGSTLITIDDLENVYVAGAGNGYVIFKYNSNGIEQWYAKYSAADYPRGIAVDSYGNVYLTGEGRNASTGNDYCTVKYNSDGVEQWVARYNGPGGSDDFAFSLDIDGSGNTYVTGMSEGNGTWGDFAKIKYNSNGIEQWIVRYYGPKNLNDAAVAIAVDDSENVYVTGYNYMDAYGDRGNYTTIKYIQSISTRVNEEKITKSSSYSLSQNYPNPFNLITKITYSIQEPTFVTFKIYDILGKEIETLVNEFQTTGIYTFNFNANNLSTGIYLYQFQAGSFRQIQKMLILR